jgi:rhodanese-related sulfurtransferase
MIWQKDNRTEYPVVHICRCVLVALPLGLLLAGCGGGRGAEVRSVSESSAPIRTAGQDAPDSRARGVSRGDAGLAARPDQLLGYTITPEPRHDITLDEFREHVRNKTAVIIDARGTADFAKAHVRGALNVPAGRKEAYWGPIREAVAPDQLIIIYCNGPLCDSGDMVYEYAASQGFTNMRVFKPGWETLSTENDLR